MADATEVYNEGAEGFRDKDALGDITLKKSAIEIDNKGDQMEAKNLSYAPYHTHETEQINKAAAEEIENAPAKDYEYKANGYTVTECKAKATGPRDEYNAGVRETRGQGDSSTYVVQAEGFEKAFTTRRDAEIYVETHALAHKDMPVGISR